MTDEELFDLLRTIILLATGVPECILADPNIGAPEGEYCSVRPSQSVENKGQPIIRKANAGALDITVDVRAQLISEVSINFYRGEALHFARKLKGANKRPSISALLFAADLGWNRTGPVNNLTALQDDNQEQRAQISVYIMYEEFDAGDVETINAIKKVPYSITNVKNEDLASGIIE